jgi:hypothetical protein
VVTEKTLLAVVADLRGRWSELESCACTLQAPEVPFGALPASVHAAISAAHSGHRGWLEAVFLRVEAPLSKRGKVSEHEVGKGERQ